VPTRALEFMMAIMGRLLEKPEMSMSEVVYEQYHLTLSKWHGFWATSAFNVSRAWTWAGLVGAALSRCPGRAGD
jgi:hypothetical protein